MVWKHGAAAAASVMLAFAPDYFSDNPLIVGGGFLFGAFLFVGFVTWGAVDFFRRKKPTWLSGSTVKIWVIGVSAILLSSSIMYGAWAIQHTDVVGKNYVYIRADTPTAIYPDGRAELFLQNASDGPFATVRYFVSPFVTLGDRQHSKYYEVNIGGERLNVLPGGQFLPGQTLQAGHYFVEIDTNKKHFNQSLRLEWVKDKLVQTTELVERKTGKQVLSTKGKRFGF